MIVIYSSITYKHDPSTSQSGIFLPHFHILIIANIFNNVTINVEICNKGGVKNEKNYDSCNDYSAYCLVSSRILQYEQNTEGAFISIISRSC